MNTTLSLASVSSGSASATRQVSVQAKARLKTALSLQPSSNRPWDFPGMTSTHLMRTHSFDVSLAPSSAAEDT